jgi:hypothetical protein
LKQSLNFTSLICFLLIGILSCNKNKKVLDEDFINLYPDTALIKRNYYKYSTIDPFQPNDSLFTPIEPSKSNPKRAKTLIKSSYSYDLQYFYKYIDDKMDGKYNDYLFENGNILYRYYLKFYKKNELQELDTKEKIENYFDVNKIDYFFLKKNKRDMLIYLLKKKNQEYPAYCVINSTRYILEIYLMYNAKDTVRSLSSQAVRPFLGVDIEN